MEIMDAELYAVYRALEYLKQQRLEEKQAYIFIDSQAAIKRLQLNSCRPESDFLTTIVPLSDDLDRLYELCRRCLSSYD